MAALVRTRVNLDTSPAFIASSGLGGWGAVTGSDVPTLSTEQVAPGETHSLRFARGAGTANPIGRRTSAASAALMDGAGTYVWSALIWVPSLMTGAQVGFRVNHTGNTLPGAVYTAVRDGWVELSLPFVYDAVNNISFDMLDNHQIPGGFMFLGRSIITKTDAPVTYFRGDSPRSIEAGTRYSLTHEWEGTPYASRSIQKAYEQETLEYLGGPGRGGWRYFATRLNGDGTESFLDFEVPLTDPEIEEALSATGSISGKIDPEIARLVGPDGRPIFEEWSTAIYAEVDGEIRGGGILTHSQFSGKAWEIEAGGFIGYWKDMPYTGNGQHYVETDTLDIVRFIIDHVQNQDGGDLGLTYDNLKSGLLVGSELASEEYDPEGGEGGLTLQSQAYKLAYYQDHDLLSNIDDLAEDTPFDYRERHWWAGDAIVHRLEFGTKASHFGRRRDDLRFTIGENVFVLPQVERAGEDYASEVYALGAGEGAKMIRGYAAAPRSRLRRVAIVSDSSMRKINRANETAKNELNWRQNLDNFTAVTVRNHPHAPLGSVSVGDEVFIEGETGWVELGAWCRVVACTLKPDAGIMDLTLVRTDRSPA